MQFRQETPAKTRHILLKCDLTKMPNMSWNETAKMLGTSYFFGQGALDHSGLVSPPVKYRKNSTFASAPTFRRIAPPYRCSPVKPHLSCQVRSGEIVALVDELDSSR